MENPWKALQNVEKGPYIAPCDREAVCQKEGLHLELLPVPFSGNVYRAKVVVLLTNPGYDCCDAEDEGDVTTGLRDKLKANLDPDTSELFFIREKYKNTSAGKWYRKYFFKSGDGRLSKAGCTEEQVAKNLMVVEFFPYHSSNKSVLNLREILPSQQYSFEIVRRAMKNGLMILIMRSEEEWFGAVQGLKDYKNCYTAKNKQNAWISKGNFDEGCFEKIVKLIKEE